MIQYTANHTFDPYETIDIVYEVTYELPTHQIFNLLDGELV